MATRSTSVHQPQAFLRCRTMGSGSCRGNKKVCSLFTSSSTFTHVLVSLLGSSTVDATVATLYATQTIYQSILDQPTLYLLYCNKEEISRNIVVWPTGTGYTGYRKGDKKKTPAGFDLSISIFMWEKKLPTRCSEVIFKHSFRSYVHYALQLVLYLIIT